MGTPFACLKFFRSEICYTIFWEGLHPGPNTLVLKIAALTQENSSLKIDRSTQKRSPWLFLLLLYIASLFPLLHQDSRVIISLDPVKQESSVVEVDLLGLSQVRLPNFNINTGAAVRDTPSKNNTDPRHFHRDPAITNNKKENPAGIHRHTALQSEESKIGDAEKAPSHWPSRATAKKH